MSAGIQVSTDKGFSAAHVQRVHARLRGESPQKSPHRKNRDGGRGYAVEVTRNKVGVTYYSAGCSEDARAFTQTTSGKRPGPPGASPSISTSFMSFLYK